MFKSKKEKIEKEQLKNETENIDLEESLNDKNDSSGSDESVDQDTENNTDTDSNTLLKLEKQLLNLKDQLLRKAAEFENYKRRTEAEFSNIYKYASENLLVELLPVLDDFERVNNTWNDKHDTETLKKGIDLVYEKFKNTLQKQGLKEMDSVGKPFDVNLHDAIMQKENDELEANTVTDEVEKGYYLKEKVIRHAKVVVSKKTD